MYPNILLRKGGLFGVIPGGPELGDTGDIAPCQPLGRAGCPERDGWSRFVPSQFGTPGARTGRRVGSQANGVQPPPRGSSLARVHGGGVWGGGGVCAPEPGKSPRGAGLEGGVEPSNNLWVGVGCLFPPVQAPLTAFFSHFPSLCSSLAPPTPARLPSWALSPPSTPYPWLALLPP